MTPQAASPVLRFGPYEFDANGQSLRKHGVRIKLQGQPLQLLAALVEVPGATVSREALRNRLWSADTYGDFESGLNTAIKRLRVALSDSADQPVYIETVTRTGYRFIAPISPVPMPSTESPFPQPSLRPPSSRRHWLGYTAVAAASIGAGYAIRARRPVPRWTYRQVTFRQGEVTSARYTPDGQSIVFAAQFERTPGQLYLNNGVSPESRAIGLTGYSLASISRRGELALNHSGGTMPIRGGTLARVPMNGGSPAVADHDIISADWAPEATTLAVTRAADGATQLEFPPGNVLHSTPGWLSSLRVSPDGRLFALFEHPVRHDDAGFIRLVDRQGRTLARSKDWDVAGGLAWRSNDELWFTASGDNSPKSLWSLDRSGRSQPLLSGPGVLTLCDVQADGRALLLRQSRRLEMIGSLRGQPQRELSGHDWSRVADLSADGRLLLFDETGEAAGAAGATYLHDAVGGHMRRLGEGLGFCLSPDARHALMVRREDRRRLILLPLEGGSPSQWPSTGLVYQWARFYPDGQQLFGLASADKQGLRIYRIGRDGRSVALTPAGMVRHAALTRDGKRLAVLAANGKLLIYPAVEPGPAVEVAVSGAWGPILWQPDGRHLYVQSLDVLTQVPADVALVDTQTGRLTPWREIGPPDPVGVNSVTRVMISQDEKSWVSSYRRVRSELFQVTQ